MRAEGYVTTGNHKTWYRVEGSLDRSRSAPIVVLHGGPGLPHNYLEPLAELACDDRAVVFYDQLGCGNSDRPDDDELWVMSTFETELDQVLDQLNIERFHLFGHSWGGWLALLYVLDRQPAGASSLVLASTCASTSENTISTTPTDMRSAPSNRAPGRWARKLSARPAASDTALLRRPNSRPDRHPQQFVHHPDGGGTR